MGDFKKHLIENLDDVPVYQEHVRDYFDALLEATIEEILDQFWYVNADLNLTVTPQQKKELLEYVLTLDTNEKSVEKAMQAWYDEMLSAEDRYNTSTQHGRDRRDEVYYEAMSNLNEEIIYFIHQQLRSFDNVREQLNKIELKSIEENPENIKELDFPSKEIQELALKLGGDHIFLLIKNPDPEITQKYRHLKAMKGAGILGMREAKQTTLEHIKKYIYGLGKKVWDEADNQRKIVMVNRQPLFAVFFQEPPPQDIMGKMYKIAPDLLSWVHWDTDDPRFIETAKLFIKRNPESFYNIMSRSFRPGENITKVNQIFWDLLFSEHSEWARNNVLSLASRGKNMIIPLEYQKILIDENPKEIAAVYQFSKEGQEYFLDKHGKASYPLLKNPHPEIKEKFRYQDALRRSGIMNTRPKIENFKEFIFNEEDQTPNEDIDIIQEILENEFPKIHWEQKKDYILSGNIDSQVIPGSMSAPKFDDVLNIIIILTNKRTTSISAYLNDNKSTIGFGFKKSNTDIYHNSSEPVEQRAQKIIKYLKIEIDKLVKQYMDADPKTILSGTPRQNWPEFVIIKALQIDPMAIKYYKNPPKEHQRIVVDLKKAAFELIDNPDPEIEKEFKYVKSMKRSGILSGIQK